MARQLLHYLVTERYGEDQLAGVYVWKCPNSEADSQRDALYNTEMVGASGIFVPKAVRVRVDKGAYAGNNARITAWYKSVRVAGKARIRSGGTSSRAVRLRKDILGDPIFGPDDDGINTWEVVRGSNYVPEGVEVTVVEAAYNSLDDFLTTARNWKGKVNSGVLTNLKAETEALLLWDYRYRKELAANLWYCDYIFHVSPYKDASGNLTGWNVGCLTQKKVVAIQEVPVVDLTLAGKSYSARKQVLLPYSMSTAGVLTKTTAALTTNYFTADFSALDGMIVL